MLNIAESLFFDTKIVAPQVQVMAACLAPFLAAPRIHLGYSLDGHTMSQSLPLPVVVTKFCTPPEAAVPREAFFQRWRALNGAGPLLCLARLGKLSVLALGTDLPTVTAVACGGVPTGCLKRVRPKNPTTAGYLKRQPAVHP